MSKCKKLKNLYFTMLNKCEVDKKCASIMEKKFVYYRKWLKNTCVPLSTSLMEVSSRKAKNSYTSSS
jgi:hypothetical protein